MKGKQSKQRTDRTTESRVGTRRWRTRSILHKSPGQLGLDLGLREPASNEADSDVAEQDNRPG